MRRKTTPDDKNEAKAIKEKEVEKYLTDRVNEEGGHCWKWNSMSKNGVPDRLIIMNGCFIPVELKRPYGKPRADQLDVHGLMREAGVNVFVIDNFEKCDELIALIKSRKGRGGF